MSTIVLDPTPYIMLFIVLDPVGIIPYYQAIISKVPPSSRKEVLRRAVLAALAMLLGFALLGEYLFGILGVTLGDFQIAAGLILLIYAVSSIFEINLGATGQSTSVAIFPLATPLLAGPGSITTLIYIKYIYGLGTAIAATVINIALAYPILASSNLILRFLGRHGSLFIDKFMSLILAGFAVSIIREGIQALLGG
ncbi:MAG: MarC family protein [Desulfurococcales archaeon]|nr:MarC family protein [Desulfurococcales archaeon]